MIAVISNDKNLSFAIKQEIENVKEYFVGDKYKLSEHISEIIGINADEYVIDIRDFLDTEEDIYINLMKIYKMTKSKIYTYAKGFSDNSKIINTLKAGGFNAYMYSENISDIREDIIEIRKKSDIYIIDEEKLTEKEKDREEILKFNKELKDSIKISEDKMLKIAVVGSQRRIGTTTLALNLTRTFNLDPHNKACYIESNTTGYTKALKDEMNAQYFAEYDELKIDGDSIFCDPKKIKDIENLGYTKIIYDFGELTESNISSILEKDIVIAISGRKALEVNSFVSMFKKLKEYKQVVFVFNFIPDKEDVRNEIISSMESYGNRTFFLNYAPDETTLTMDNKEMILSLLKTVTMILAEAKQKKKSLMERLFGR